MKKICLFLSLALFALSCTDTPPEVTSINPVSGGYGTELVITGSDFGRDVSSNSVTIGGVDAEVTAVTSTTLTVKVPALTEGDNHVVVSAPGGEADAGTFNYLCDVFVGGYERNSSNITVAKYWKNGVAVTLSDGTYGTMVNGIAVSGDDVYAVGIEYTSSSVRHVKFWANGIESTLSSSTNAGAFDIAIDGEDVYIVGYETIDGNEKVVYWKNGTPVYLTDGSNVQLGRAITISDGDVYIAGAEQFETYTAAKYWKNGTPVYLNDDLPTSIAYDIIVDGEDVYVCGKETANALSTGKYWKNGVVEILGDGINSSYALGMGVKGTDTHIIGFGNYWINGVKSSFAEDETDVSYYAILVKDDDIYVAGHKGINPDIEKAAYWKNGTEVLLTDGTYNACANAITVR